MRLPGRDIPWKVFFRELRAEVKKDNLSDAAGALTFFGVLAIFPFLVFLVSLASLIIEPAQAQTLLEQLSKVAPKEVTTILGDRLRSLVSEDRVGLVSLGALGAIWAASSGVMAVIRALNLAYDVKESRPKWKVRIFAILFTLGGGALGLLATLAAVATPALAEAIGGPIGEIILWLRIPVAALLVMMVWAVAYYVLPDVDQEFKFITPGSVVGVTIWIVASLGFSFYVTNFAKYDATYGSLGGMIVLLLWMWISSQVLLLGAEVNAIIEERWSPEGKAAGEKTFDGSVYEPAQGQGQGQTGGARPATGLQGRAGGRPSAGRRQGGVLERLALTLSGALVGAAIVAMRRRTA
ncbi:MAG TPA: YihY/virulence factor BrkB family protein [Myxococcaceae bacterium]|nr:YihY/virulence factor BrkB family protein [Myxococcaceae bacterium]